MVRGELRPQGSGVNRATIELEKKPVLATPQLQQQRLASKGYVTVIGPLGRASTRYKVHPQGVAALDRAP